MATDQRRLKTGLCENSKNSTNRSWWMVHTPPTSNTGGELRIPPTAVGGWFIPSLPPDRSCRRNPTYTQLSGILTYLGPYLISVGMKDPPTAVGGILYQPR